MIKLFQNQGKTLRWVMGGLLFLIAASMVITLVPSVFSTQQTGTDAQVLVEVGDLAVTMADLDSGLRQYVRAGSVPPESLAFLANNMVDNLISEKVLLNEANELGLTPTEAELAQWIRDQLPDLLFPNGQYVGTDAYRGFVQQQFQKSIPEFEADLLKDLAIEMRLRRLVTDNVNVGDEELKKIFHQQNDMVQLEWTAVERDGLRSQVTVSEEKLAEYFEANKLRYRKQEERSLKLISIGANYATDNIDLSDDEIELYYSQNQYRFENPERYQTRHILFSTMEKSEEETEEARKKAEDILQQLRDGGDFAALAAANSEDPGNAQSGGDLGWVTQGMMVPEFEQAMFGLQTGELSPAPVKTQFGYHLLRVDAKEAGTVKPLNEVRDRIREDLIIERSQSTRLELMDTALTTAQQYGVELEKAGAEVNLPVQVFGSFSRATMPADLPKLSQLVSAIFQKAPEEVFSVTQDGTLYIGVITGITPPRDGTLDEFRDPVRISFVDDEASSLARSRAEELAEKARANDGDLVAAARSLGLKASKSNFVKRADSIEGLGPVSSLGSDAFDKTDGSVVGPVGSGSNFVVYRSLERRAADEATLENEGSTIRQSQLDYKRNQMFEFFRAQKLKEYTDDGRIVRYDSRIQEYLNFIRSQG